MADRRVRYVLEVDYDGKSALMGAADDLRGVDEAAEEAGEGLERAESGFSKLQAGVVTLQAGLGVAQQAFDTVAQAAQVAYETLSHGAELLHQDQQFEGLANSIGTTAAALENDLKPALMGLQSDAEMVAGASQLINLGLANNHDEVIALSEVAGQLGWNMEVLGLTIANQSTQRLDSLGLSITDVRGKMAELVDAGMATDEAFKWAIIEEGRKKIEILGPAAETAAGQLMILENAAENIQDEFARGTAEGFAESLSEIGGGAQAAGDGLAYAAGGMGMFLGQLGGGLLQLGEVATQIPGIQLLAGLGVILAQDEIAAAERQRQLAQDRADLVEMTNIYARYELEAAAATRMSAEAADYALSAWSPLVGEYELASAAAAMAAEDGFYLAEALESQAAAAEELAQQQAALEEWVTYTAEATAKGGDFFTAAMNMADGQWSVAEAAYAAADAQGAGMGILGDIAVQYDLIDEKAQAAFEAQAQQQGVIENLALAAANGKIPWEEYGVAVEKALQWLETGIPAPPEPVRIPVEVEWIDGDPTALVGQAVVHPQVSANYDDVVAALGEVDGMLNGFADTPWEATATLNIDDVENKVGRLRELIDDIPVTKEVTVNVTMTGDYEMLEELRAMGWE